MRTSDIAPRNSLSIGEPVYLLSLPMISGVVIFVKVLALAFVDELTNTPFMYKDAVFVVELYVPAA